MTRKTTECYAAVLEFIENRVFQLKPSEIITDFEEGMRIAIRNQYPNTILRGCWFHYCAAIRKKCLKLGLHSLLKSNDDAKIIKKELMSIPLLPIESIEEGYLLVRNKARQCGLFEKFENLFSYYENYWLVQVN